MIVREMDDGRLLCIPQPAHALMAAQFCRHWGNRDFTPPRPYDLVLTAVAQHDNGWIEWEAAPRLRSDGYPMDFATYTDQREKTRLWQRGIDRAWAQHPYTALLISGHARLLYESFLAQNLYDEANRPEVERFLADQRALRDRVWQLLGGHDGYAAALCPAAVEANTRLLKFGDRAALQVSIPWPPEAILPRCPIDDSGGFTDIRICYDDETITFDPWPYHVDEFEVAMEGYLLPQRMFACEADYHRALSQAAYYRKTWCVRRNA